jgi:hypothetical protein
MNYLHHIHPPTFFPAIPSSPVPIHPCGTYSTLLFSDFVEEKNIKDKQGNMAFLIA